jgi:hypothetical protein
MERSIAVHIGNRDPRSAEGVRLSRAERARMAAEIALAERDYALTGFESPAKGSGIIAVAINGEKRLMHLGRDEADALYNLAHLASRPASRAGGW